MEESHRRRLLWHGFLLLLIALLLGFPTALAPHGRVWMATHVTALVGALLVLSVAAAWPELQLGETQRRFAFGALLAGAYSNLTVNVLGALVDFPGPATQPGVHAPLWQSAVFAAFGVVLVPALLGAVGTVLYGLRRGKE
jgi:hypothetical protein